MSYCFFSIAIFLLLLIKGFDLILKKTLFFRLSELFLIIPLLLAFVLKHREYFLLSFAGAFLVFEILRLSYDCFAKKHYYLLEVESFYFNLFLYEELTYCIYNIKEKYKLSPASLIFHPSGLLICDKSLTSEMLEDLENLFCKFKKHYLFSRILGILYLYVAVTLVFNQRFYYSIFEVFS